MAQKPQKPQKQKKRTSLIGRLFRGQVISADFFARHWLPVAVVTVAIMVYITNKYVCQTNMEKIAALNRELEVIDNEKARQRSVFMGRTRESAMQHMVDSLHLNLHVQSQPPYKLSLQ